jgi:hypothetical protein
MWSTGEIVTGRGKPKYSAENYLHHMNQEVLIKGEDISVFKYYAMT